MKLEICVDDVAGIQAATEGGADRLELCSALALGGLTPSHGLMRVAAQGPLPVMAMIRPRAGCFEWAVEEVAAMEADIVAAREVGLAGVVIGATRNGRLDLATVLRLIRVAGDMEVTLHRCIDLLDDPLSAIDEAGKMGITRILSSGGALRASDGIACLSAMQARAGKRLVIMPGGGITPATLPHLLARFPCCEIHASASTPAITDLVLSRFGFLPAGARRTNAAQVAALKALCPAR